MNMPDSSIVLEVSQVIPKVQNFLGSNGPCILRTRQKTNGAEWFNRPADPTCRFWMLFGPPAALRTVASVRRSVRRSVGQNECAGNICGNCFQ